MAVISHPQTPGAVVGCVPEVWWLTSTVLALRSLLSRADLGASHPRCGDNATEQFAALLERFGSCASRRHGDKKR